MSHRTRRSTGGRAVLYASGDDQRTVALSELLRNRGHAVTNVSGIREILDNDGAADVLVLAADAPAANGPDSFGQALALLDELNATGIAIPTVLLAPGASFELCRRAIELGVRDVVRERFEPASFVCSVERAADSGGPNWPSSLARLIEYDTGEDALERATTDLHTFLARADVAPPHVARIVCATAEIVDNACRYARPGWFTVEVSVRRTRVYVQVRDGGPGFDATAVRLDSVPPALPVRSPRISAPRAFSASRSMATAGLSRAIALSDGFDVRSDTTGSDVELEFELSPVRHDGSDTAEVRECLPAHVMSVIAAFESLSADALEVPSALNLTIKRLLPDTTLGSTVTRQG